MSNYLIHHGIKGQKWGVRRFQNKDGTRTNAGKNRESENRAVLRGVRKAFYKSWSAYKETVKPGTLESTLVDSPAREKAIRILQDDKNFQKALAPLVERAKAVQQKYKGKMSKDIDRNEYSRELYDIDRAVGELSVKAGIVKSNGPGDPEEFDRWAYIGFVAARELDEVTGDPGIGDALIHGETKIMYPDQHNYLIHWLKKGEKAKYVDKIKLANGRWRYFYSQAELEAYKLKRKLGASAGELANKAKQGLRGLKEGALDAGARAVVGVAKRNKTVYDRLGGSWKTNAQDSASYANALQRQANVEKRDADTARAQAAAARRNGGKYVLDTGAVIGEKTESEWANKRDHQAKDSAIRASGARQDAAGYQKQYDRSILGRAEARVKRADVRKATEATRNKLLGAASKATSKKTEGQKVGSIFRDARGDLDRLKREQEARKKSRSSSVFKDGQADLERQKRERESRAKQKNSSVFKNGREELERQRAMRSKSDRPQSRKKHVTSGGTGVHKRRRIDYSRFER